MHYDDAFLREHLGFARMVAYRTANQLLDKNECHSVAGEALWEAMRTWPEQGNFKWFLRSVVKRRVIDDIRKKHGRYPEKRKLAMSKVYQTEDIAIENYGAIELLQAVSKADLTARERSVLLGLADGRNMQDIAADWRVAPSRATLALKTARHKVRSVLGYDS